MRFFSWMVWTRDNCADESLRRSTGEGEGWDSLSDHLLGDHDDGFDGEPSVAVVEQVLQTRAQEVDDQYVVQSLLAKVVHVGDAGYRTMSLDLHSSAFHFRHRVTYGIR